MHHLDNLLKDFEFMTVGDYVRQVSRRRIGFENSSH